MQFTVLPAHARPASSRPGGAFLVRDDRDGHHFKTAFHLLCCDARRRAEEIGPVEIGRFGMTAPARTPLPGGFEALGEGLFSLGQNDAYHEKLGEPGLRAAHRAAGPERRRLRPGPFARARPGSVMGTSRLRSVAAGSGKTDAADVLPALIGGHPHEYEPHIDVLTGLATEHVGPVLTPDPAGAEPSARPGRSTCTETTPIWCGSVRHQCS
ncbi:hypothetical protein F0L17_25800 [Streptomyces sp. TRM43335]|uniref:Uncharacterized protein n=1 Tax=Streptomyces taklimakanensis TaxID=2569853 RepID=A0A6G2BJR6_9ACTN|nr:hypothetical protein [Streptomyces taklimakanensis]MTE22454.1 hypothetical protein [Streptomyces taklimakanensis]